MKLLRDAEEPITGSEFAKQTNVSRQVIVQDVSILKAKKEPIMATSKGMYCWTSRRVKVFWNELLYVNIHPSKHRKN